MTILPRWELPVTWRTAGWTRGATTTGAPAPLGEGAASPGSEMLDPGGA
ncbi:hypothetical protein [Rhodococcus opacus]|nr:hypothetical protein [Rhodococcus opacus]